LAKELLDDAELIAALPILEKRAKAAQAAVDKQLPDLKTKTDATTAAQAAADVISQEVDKLRAIHDAVAPKLTAAQSQLAPFSEKSRDLKRRRELIERQLAGTRLTISLQKNRAELLAKESAVPNLVARRKELDPAMVVKEKEVAVLKADAAKMEATYAASSSLAATADAALKNKRAAAELVIAAQKQWKETVSRLTASQEVEAAAAISENYARTVQRLDAELKQLQVQVTEAIAAKAKLEPELKVAQTNFQAAATEFNTMQVSASTLDKELTELTNQLDALRAATTEQTQESIDRWSQQGALATLTPLTPEEMGWSILVTTGMIDNYRNSAFAGLKKAATAAATAAKTPVPTDDWQPDPLALELAIHASYEAAIQGFVPLFGAGAGQPQNEFFATVDQALFVSNGGTINSWLNPSGNNLTARLDKLLEQPDAFADELYLSVLTRTATAAEKTSVAEYLTAAKSEERIQQSSRELTWALLAAVEFRFNH
jgi:hypothetical protein